MTDRWTMRLLILFFTFLLFSPVLSPLVPLCLGATPETAKKEGRSQVELYKRLDLFTKVLGYIQDEYVEGPDEKEIIYGAVRGMLATLDPHSLFLPADVYKELKVDAEGRFGGIGLEITLKNNLLTVVTPIEGSPAQKAGIREGDRVIKIDGISAKELDLSEAVRRMRGKRGTHLTLTILHEGSKEPREITLIRDIIRIKSVRFEMPEDRIGYIRISSFQEETAQEMRRALNLLSRQSTKGLSGLILDLRNNPGGLLNQAVDVADLFLESGTIVTTVSREKEIDKRVASRDGQEPTYPMIVMVNGGSASAAEIVAGALQDSKRAVLLGTQTFGKGSVQTIFELGDGAALKLTVAKYYTASGRSIQAEGIRPDIIVAASEGQKGTETLNRDRPVREKDLKGHLQPEKVKKGVQLIEKGLEDYQKKVALDYLRSWELFRR